VKIKVFGKTLRANRSARIICIAVASLILAACPSCEKAPPAPDFAALLAKIPAGDPAKYPDLHATKVWHNPYLVIRTDGVGLITSIAANEEQILKPEEVLDVLSRLPAPAWPYGRVVAILVDERSASSEQDRVAIRRNRGMAAGALQGAHVAVSWVPVPES
jgi:hypothetical protein